TVLLDYAMRRSQPDNQTVELEPQLSGSQMDDAVTHALRGCVDEWDGRWDDALQEYNLALQANGDHLWALYRRGQVRRQLDRASGLEDYQSLVLHDRAEELFGQQPVALRVHIPLANALINKAALERDKSKKRIHREEAVSLARRGVERARLTTNRDVV